MLVKRGQFPVSAGIARGKPQGTLQIHKHMHQLPVNVTVWRGSVSQPASCALSSCGIKTDILLWLQVWYCGKECQKANHKAHKKVCAKLAAAGELAEGVVKLCLE
jgi:hypothetical protein